MAEPRADLMYSWYCRTGRCDRCTNDQCLHSCHEGGVREPRPDAPPLGYLVASASVPSSSSSSTISINLGGQLLGALEEAWDASPVSQRLIGRMLGVQ